MVLSSPTLGSNLLEESPLVEWKLLLLRITDTRMCVWLQHRIVYSELNIVETIRFGGGSVMVWVSVTFDYILDLITISNKIDAQNYQREIRAASVMPHFDNYHLQQRPLVMDNNATTHSDGARAVCNILRRVSCSNAMFQHYLAHLGHPWLRNLWKDISYANIKWTDSIRSDNLYHNIKANVWSEAN